VKFSFVAVIAVLLLPQFLFAQEEKKVQELEELEVVVTKLNRYYVDSTNVYISREEIEAMQPDDLGEILKKVPGVNVKSYGGLGGLKTISVRGLGGQHTNLIVDGFLHHQTQTGQVNMGAIQMDVIEKVQVQRGGTSELLVPPSAQLAGNVIALETFLNTSPKIPLQQKLISKFGSFGQIDQHYLLKIGNSKVYGGGYLKYRTAHGAYPYSIMNYQTVEKGIRKNNDFTDLNGGFNMRVHPVKNHQFNFFTTYLSSYQGIPGSIVFYNDLAKQKLSNQNLQIKGDYQGKVSIFNYRLHYAYTADSLFYYDPDYLNAAGELKAIYLNKMHDIGLNISFKAGKLVTFNAGTQGLFSRLNSNQLTEIVPQRQHFFSYFKTYFHYKKWEVVGQIGHQHVTELTQSKTHSKLNPFVEAKWSITKQITLVTYYRNSFRMPNFNELYYSSVGNLNLKPEEANQVSFGLSTTLLDRNRIYLGFQANGYFQRIDNMILTIPTKNLFVWSIQNIGKNQVTGADLIASLSWNFAKRWSLQTTINYTYQQSLDISDKNSPSYRNLVAYSPEHISNMDLSIQYHKFGIRVSSFHSSHRFALNENIAANRIAGFSSYDLSIFNRFEIDKNNAIRLQLTVKNFTNAWYAYVKNFVMPGRHFLFTFVYEFI